MHCLPSILVKSFRYCFIGPLILGATLAAQQAHAQDRMMRGGDDRMMRGGDRGGGMGGVGTGLAIGIGAGMMIDELSKSQGKPDDQKNASKPKTDKTIAKKPPPKDTPKLKTPDNPPIKQTNAPPDQTPPATPIPPAGGPPPTTTTDRPPDRPGVPPTQTATTPPPDLPKTSGTTPPEDPSDIPGRPKIYGHDRDEDCPQRGMGCAALIIDFQAKYLGDLTPLKDHLAADNACEVEFFTPHYLSGKDLQAANAKLRAESKSGDPPPNFNNLEYQRMLQVIERHHQRVARGAEIAIEITRGEGYPAEVRSCGSVGPDGLGSTLDRQVFHDGNYQAANKHVCSWIVADFSCYSGFTPQVFDELNNLGHLPLNFASGATTAVPTERACQPTQNNSCSAHAAWELDVAMGQSKSSRQACALFTPSLRNSLIEQFKRQGNSIKFDASWSHFGYGSYYSDHGYRYCDPVVREGYTSEPRPLAGKPVEVAPVSASSTTNRP